MAQKYLGFTFSSVKTLKEEGGVFSFSWFWASTSLTMTRKVQPQSGSGLQKSVC